MKAFKLEYFPDMKDTENGSRCFSMSFSIHNSKRFVTLSKKEKSELLGHIKIFQETLTVFKKRLTEGRTK